MRMVVEPVGRLHYSSLLSILDELRPGDFVLADKGFKLNDQFQLKEANLIVPKFVVKKN